MYAAVGEAIQYQCIKGPLLSLIYLRHLENLCLRQAFSEAICRMHCLMLYEVLSSNVINTFSVGNILHKYITKHLFVKKKLIFLHSFANLNVAMLFYLCCFICMANEIQSVD